MTLADLAQSLHQCQSCKLSKLGRSQVVFGVGNPKADIMFIGEAPGFHEDRQGEPFVGAAGKLLNDLLASAGLSRSEIYIANVIKCRPPNNRDPEPDEVATCKPFLVQQVALINPKVLCTLGRWAAETILERKLSITKVRGHVIRHNGWAVFPLLHPAAALHQGNLLDPLREDFQKLKAFLEEERTARSPIKPPAHEHSQPASPAGQMSLF